MKKAIWILYDQLYLDHPAFQLLDPQYPIIMAETSKELDLKYAHKKRTAFILSCYKTHYLSLKSLHQAVLYLKALDQSSDQIDEMTQKTLELNIQEVLMVKPKDIEVREKLKSLPFHFTFLKDPNFISDEDDSLKWFNQKAKRMELFYQKMRQETGILMQDGFPMGGQYNFDKQNQNTLKTLPEAKKRRSY
jgi:deoxyribodipyrimidine photolyase-related protein